MVLGRKRGKEMGYLGNKLKGKYHKDTFQTAVNMAWPAIVESFFIAFAGLVDSLMVSSLGSYAVAAVGLTTQPKLLGLAFFFALNVSISALVARRRGEQRQGAANDSGNCACIYYPCGSCIQCWICGVCKSDYPSVRFNGGDS